MPSSLGIYIEPNLIKYAKVEKGKDSLKVEAFNVVFYENLGDAINKIVSETYSFKCPICINVSNELYNYYDLFSMLSKTDMKNSINIEFEMLCNEKNYNRNSLETRYIIMTNKENAEKVKALHIAVNKTDINKKMQELAGFKVASIAPVSTSITNLLEITSKDNIAIVNIEEQTKITTVIEGQINRVDTIDAGMGQILEAINKTENSMQKSYDVCKNITIYTQETQTLQTEDSEHLEEVMPVLYKIVTESKKIIDGAFANISKVYITGLGTAINNIDLYFQEYMVNVKCEILKPYFVESSSVKIPVKDYIEVNSAIALAMDGLGYGNKELNFTSSKGISAEGLDLNQIIKKMFSSSGTKKNFNFSFSTPLDVGEKLMLRIVAILCMVIVIYSAFSINTMKQINTKTGEINTSLALAKSEINKINYDYSTIAAKVNTYTALINSVNDLSDTGETVEQSRVIPKDAIPNLLNRIMFVIPQKVQITSIENTSDTHIVIKAQSEKYEQLGYFKAVLDSKGILVNVKSTSGMKESGLVKVTIEGDLP